MATTRVRWHLNFRFSVILLLTLSLAAPALAQEATGRVVGAVTDSQGAAIPGTRIVVRIRFCICRWVRTR